MMAECNFNVVRVGEFAWSAFEPEPGRYDFSWMDEAMDHLARNGIKVIMGTPTGGVPPWFTAKYPDSLIVKRSGLRAEPVNRYYTCFNHPEFIATARRLVEAQVDHYAGDPRITGWHIHNELGGTRCFCGRCKTVFQAWLKEKYGTIAELNRRWGTMFWSHVYSDWSEIPMPLDTHNNASPSQYLAYERFSMEVMYRFAGWQSEIIRKKVGERWVSTNLRCKVHEKWISTNIDPHDYRLFGLMDCVGYNNYPHAWDNNDDAVNSMRLDGIRPPSARLNPFDFEQRGGQPGWDLVSRLSRPGEMRLLAWQPLAHGTDGLTYFRWRIAWFGHENLWGGIVRHDGTFHPNVQPAARLIGAELKKVGGILHGSRVESEVAMIRSADSVWALSRQPQQETLNYDAHMLDYYREGIRFGVNMDVVEGIEDLERYKVLIMVLHYVMTPALADRLHKFVEKGGVLLGTFRSAVVDDDVVIPEQEAPVWMQDLFGAKVEAYDVQEISRYNTNPKDAPGRIRLTAALGGGKALAHTWYDLLSLDRAEPLAFYDTDFYRGTPAISEKRFGKGRAIYIGTASEPKVYRALFRRACKLAGVKPLAQVPEGVEVRERTKGDTRLRFLLNYTKEAKSVRNGPGWTDLLTGKKAPTTVRLPMKGVGIFRKGAT
jgi:beta-galactosidase